MLARAYFEANDGVPHTLTAENDQDLLKALIEKLQSLGLLETALQVILWTNSHPRARSVKRQSDGTYIGSLTGQPVEIISSQPESNDSR